MNDIMESLHAAAAKSSTLSRRDLNASGHDSLIEAKGLSQRTGVSWDRTQWGTRMEGGAAF